MYDDAKDSYEDHSQFLLRDRYARLFELDPTDYKGWAKGMKACGYATDPAYADRLITLIEKHELHVLDEPGGTWSGGGDVVASNNAGGDEGAPRRNVREHDVVRKASGGGGTVEVGNRHRVRTTVHGVQFVYAEAGDTQASLAKDLDLMPWQIRTYNEVGKQHGKAIGFTCSRRKGACRHAVARATRPRERSPKCTASVCTTKRSQRRDSPGMKLSLQWHRTKRASFPGDSYEGAGRGVV